MASVPDASSSVFAATFSLTLAADSDVFAWVSCALRSLVAAVASTSPSLTDWPTVASTVSTSQVPDPADAVPSARRGAVPNPRT